MTEQLHNFIESLREELRHYGELLALLDAEQNQVVRRQPGALLANAEAINFEGEAIHVARRERAQRQRDLAQSLDLSPDSRVSQIMPRLSQAHRPLITALVEESHQLLERVRQRARQNHVLLSRSLTLMEKFMHSFGAVGVHTHNGSGAVAGAVGARRGLHKASS